MAQAIAASTRGTRRRRGRELADDEYAPLAQPGVLSVQLETGETLNVDLDAVALLPAGQQAKVAAHLRELEQKFLWNPLLRYQPASCRWQPAKGLGHPPGTPCTPKCLHAQFHAAEEPLKAFFGGNRAGKTTTTLVDDLIQMTPDELLPPRLQTYKLWDCPFYCRVMTPDMKRTMVPVIYEKLKEWTPKELLKNGSWSDSFDKELQCLNLTCGCRFDFLSYEMDLNKFGGAALHRCHYDESPPASIRKECLMRLLDFNGDEVYSLTPLAGLDFTYRKIWKQRNSLKGGDPNVFAIKVSMRDNPMIDQGAAERAAAALADSDSDLATRIDGDFANAGGLVYPGWREWVVPPPPQPDRFLQSLERHQVNIDPGVRFCGITFIAYEEDLKSHTWAAFKRENFIGSDYAELIKETLADVGIPFEDVEFVIDPNAVARGLAKGENIADELAKYDIYCVMGQNDVETGVKQIRRRGRNDHLVIWQSEEWDLTVDLTEELEEYMLDIDEDSDDGEFKVVKMNDHVCDSWRYGHMEYSWLPEHGKSSDDEDSGAWWEVARGARGDREAAANGSLSAASAAAVATYY